MSVAPIDGFPALLVKIGRERSLVVADLHLGIEGEYADKGISLPSQIPKIKKELLNLVEKEKPHRLIILGDVKHGIPIASLQEWRELPGFFEELSALVEIWVIPGNHDGDLKGMIPRNVVIHDVKGVTLGKRKRVGLVHGHAWPGLELFNTEVLIMGHNHPAIEFKDKLGGKIVEPIWLKAKLKVSNLPKKIRCVIKEPPKLLVVPAFNELVGGAPVNRALPKELIGPLFKSGAVELGKAEAYLLDCTFLGEVGRLR
jgi:hypothetical protein